MKVNPKVSILARKAKSGHLVSFDYVSSKDGIKSRRVLRLGVNISKTLEKQGTPIKGKETWQSGRASGLRGVFLKDKQGRRFTHVRGTDCTHGKNHVFKVFTLDNISNIKEEKQCIL